MLNRYITCGLIQGRVGLDKDLAGLLVVENDVANLCAPKVKANIAHVEVEFGSSLDVGGCLVNVKLLKVIGNGYKKSEFSHLFKMESHI